jgi:hypothetical protein
MLRPLVYDLFVVVIPLCLGIAAFFLGRRVLRLRKTLRRLIISLTVVVVAIGAASVSGYIFFGLDSWLSAVGGGTVVLCWAALLLLGVVWSVPGRSLSTGFLCILAFIATGLIAFESSGRLYWRFCAGDLWTRVPDANGCLRQSSGVTCSPVAGAMLLHHHGIAASEGEMAYLANCSPFGTDAYNLTHALSRKIQDRSRRAETCRTDYQACVHGGWSFVAHVRRPEIGGHAIFVERATAESVDMIDPLNGERRKQSAADFQKEWDGTVIRIVAD